MAWGHAQAAYISEIDLGGPGGQGVEFSQLDPGSVHTLVIMNAVATSTSGFGMVLDVIHLPAGSGVLDVAMVTDQPWPDNTATTIPLASTDASLPTLSLSQTRLLIVMQGDSAVRQFDNPLGTDAAAAARYDASMVTDWLVLGHGDLASDYQQAGHDITTINSSLGIDLLSRLIDKDDGSIIARTNEPGEVLDMDTFYVGDLGDASFFDVAGGFRYTYTPSMSNLPLAPVPEPGSLAALVIVAGLCLRRMRPR